MNSSRTRHRFAVVLGMAVLLQALGLSPRASGAPIPPTVARSVHVSLGSVFRGSEPGQLSVERAGLVRTAVSVRTRRTIVCSPIWFTATALVWRQASRPVVDASLAAGPTRGRFGPSRGVASEPGEAPDPGTPESHPHRRATDLVWTEGARCIRFALTVGPRTDMARLRAVFVNTSGTAAGPGTGPAEGSPLAAIASAFGPQNASARSRQPNMVSRDKWGANPRYFNSAPGCSAPYYASTLKMAFVHHTAGANSYPPSQSDDIVRAIYWFHTRQRGYCDIAYNFLVDRYGKIFVGRAGGLTRPVVPASQMGFNTSTFSVSTIGNWDTATPPTAMVQSVERLLSWRLDVAHLPPGGYAHMVSAGGSTTKYPAGRHVTLHLVSGHRDTGITACPGGKMYPLLPGIRAAVNAMGGPKIYRPTESALHVTPLKRLVTFSAWANQSITWRISIADANDGTYTTMYRSGSSLDLTWNGTDGSGAPLAPGVYRVVFGGESPDGAEARPAVLPIAVNPAAPPPSPTLSPTASA